MPAEVVLMIDLVGVLMTSPFPAVRRLCETMMQSVFEHTHDPGQDRTSGPTNRSTLFLARQYSNFFFTVMEFTEKVCGRKSALARLELGEINRLEFMTEFQSEMVHMLDTLRLTGAEEMERVGVMYPKRAESLKKRYPLLADAAVQRQIQECMDVEAFLCTYEKVCPRRNVLNLLHYLRVTSKQEITLYAMGNTWECEGQYQQMVRAKEIGTESSNSNGRGDCMSSLGVDSCPVLYGGAYHSSFSLHGIFDNHVESYVHHKRKPYPDIFLDAVGEVMHRRMPSGETLRYGLKPFIFYFDDVAVHCEVARQLPGSPFTEVYFVENGALDVYNDVVSALRVVAAKDAFWSEVLVGVERDIAPLFRPPADPRGRCVSWVTEEIHNYNNNLLFARPPANELFVAPSALQTALCGQLSAQDQNRLLLLCARKLPHLFPFILPNAVNNSTNESNDVTSGIDSADNSGVAFDATLDLVRQPSLATSAGPVVFEYMQRSGYFDTHRVTLRTGSYVIRIQPSAPSPYSGVDIRREYETMRHIHNSTRAVHVPPMLLFCPASAVFDRSFFVYRYCDGDVIARISQLIQPRVHRPFSHARTHAGLRLIPKLFYRQAIGVLVALQNVPLTASMKAEVEQNRRRTQQRTHPLLHDIQTWVARYRALTTPLDCNNSANNSPSRTVETRHVSATKTSMNESATNSVFDPSLLGCAMIDTLIDQLTSCFDDTLLSQCMIPTPNRLVIVHGNFRLKSFMYSHRSLEGRAKYPPTIVSTGRFGFTRVGDPLIDVAALSIFTLLPAPSGIFGTGQKIQDMFPTASDILEMYCSMRGYLLHLDRARRENIFSVYLAALCLQRAITAVAEASHALRTHGLKPEQGIAPASHSPRAGSTFLSSPRHRIDSAQRGVRDRDAEDAVAHEVGRVMVQVKDMAQRGVELLINRSGAKM